MSSAADYWVGPTIGEGAFGNVVYAVHKETERKVAIKVIEVPTNSDATRKRRNDHHHDQAKRKLDMILNERKILSLPELKSSNWVIDLWAAFCDPESSSSRHIYFVMKLATGGDLRGLIDRGLSSPNRLSWLCSSVPHYGCQLIEAVEFLHSKGVLHCDLKPENILLDASIGQLQLADFGSSIDTKEPHTSFIHGTARYSSPEILRATAPSSLTVAIDYWSVGCILHAMKHGQSPFDRGSEALTVRAILDFVADYGTGLQNTSNAAAVGERGDSTAASNSDIIKTQRGIHNNDGDRTIEKNGDINSAHIGLSIRKSVEKDELDCRDPFQLLSQSLFAVSSDDRIKAWKSNALPLLAMKSSGGDGNHEGGTDIENILLPIPDWQADIANTTLRDGSLGWCVFHI